jgi:hypothetical protein
MARGPFLKSPLVARVLFAVALACAGSIAYIPAVSANAESLRTIADPTGGSIVTGGLPDAKTPDAAFRAGLRRMDTYFGRTLALRGVSRSNDGSLTMGTFSATRRGIRLSGLVIASYRAGASQVAAVYDNAASFPRALPQLVAHLQALPLPVEAAPAGGASSSIAAAMRTVSTTPMRSSDQTVSIRLPAGWQLKKFGEGSFIADGPDGAEVVGGVGFSLIDPRLGNPASGLGAPLPYSSDPMEAYRGLIGLLNRSSHSDFTFTSIAEKPVSAPAGIHGARVYGTSIRNGTALRFDETVGVSAPGQMGGYTMSVSGVVAPADRFERDEPEMGALYASYQLDNGARMQQVQASIAAGWAQVGRNRQMLQQTTAHDQAMTDASMANARAVQDGIDRSTAGFVHYLNDSDVLRTPNGAHVSVDQGTSDALRNFDPQHFSSVPVTQYVKGVDY